MRPRDSIGAQIRIGSALPFTVTGRSSCHRKSNCVARYVDSATTMPSGGAVDCSREAVFTTSPVTRSPMRGPRAERDDDLAGRDAHPHGQRRRIVRRRCCTSSRMRSAARIARSASSSWVTGAPKTPNTTLPTIFSTVPPNPSIWRRSSSWKGRSLAVKSSGSAPGSKPALHVGDVGEQRRDEPAFLAEGVQRRAARGAEARLLGVLGAAVGTDPHAPSLRRAATNPGARPCRRRHLDWPRAPVHPALRVPACRRPARRDRTAHGGRASRRRARHAARRHRHRQDLHDRARGRAGAAPDPGDRAEQVARGPARERVPRGVPRQRRRVLRELLRLLPTRGLHPVDRHLHREGQLGQRRDRAAAALGDGRAARAARRAHRGERLVHLRPRLARGVRGADPAGRTRAPRSRSSSRCSGSSTSSTRATT